VGNGERKEEGARNNTQDRSCITLFTQIKTSKKTNQKVGRRKEEKGEKSTPIPPPKKNKRKQKSDLTKIKESADTSYIVCLWEIMYRD